MRNLLATLAGWNPVKILAGALAVDFAGALGSVGAQTNVVLNVITIVIAVGVAFPALKSRRKDGTIKDLNDSLEARDRRLLDLADDNKDMLQQKRQIEQAAAHCREEATEWRAKYEEAKQYTAAEAVKHFEAALDAHAGRVAERHEKLLSQGEHTAKALSSIADVLERIDRRG